MKLLLYFFHLGRSPITMRLFLEKPLYVSKKKLDFSLTRNVFLSNDYFLDYNETTFHIFFYLSRSLITMKPLFIFFSSG
jgi:hypothetical protein